MNHGRPDDAPLLSFDVRPRAFPVYLFGVAPRLSRMSSMKARATSPSPE